MQTIFFNMTGISITVSVIVVLLLLMSSYLNERYSVKWRYFIWLVLAIRLMIPIDFGLTAPPVEMNFNDHAIAYEFGQNPKSALHPTDPSKPGSEGNAAKGTGVGPVNGSAANSGDLSVDYEKKVGLTLTVSGLAAGIYLTGIVVFLLWQLGLYFSFRLATRRWFREPDDLKILEAFENLKTEMGILKSIRIRVCRKILSPMVVGLFRPTLLLPHEGYQKIDLEIVLKHELVHYKRNDLWFKLLLICANALHWFNPLIYIMVREANKDIEISCDEEVLRGADLPLRKRYSERILELMRGNEHQEAPISTNFHGGKGMMKSRIRNIFDERIKKRGTLSFLMILAVILIFSECRFDIGQNNWKIPITAKVTDAYGLDESGNRESEMSDFEVSLPFDFDQNGSDEVTFSLVVSDDGENCLLKYKDKDGKTVSTKVFEEVEPGVDYGLQAANAEGTDSIMFIASIEYRGMPFGSAYRELYTWKDREFSRVDIKPLEQNLQMRIMEPAGIANNELNAETEIYLYDVDNYPVGYPVAGLYFKDDRKEGEDQAFGSITYAPMSDYDVEGYQTWGQEAINKTMTGMSFVSGETVEGWSEPSRALLETKEYVFITLPNITATVTRWYQYQNGTWIFVDGLIE